MIQATLGFSIEVDLLAFRFLFNNERALTRLHRLQKI